MKTETPLLQQYNHLKSKYPDCLLLFAVGHFYEIMGEDAEKASQILKIPLTKLETEPPRLLAGFAQNQLDQNLPKLLKGDGYREGFKRIAVADQLTE